MTTAIGLSLPAPVTRFHGQLTGLLQRYASPAFDLLARLWIARVFFLSGRTKIADWESTLDLFREEYKVPLLPVPAAAALGATFELTMPVLLVLGLGARIAVLPLIAMTLVIQFVLGQANPDYDNVEHIYWLFLLGMIAIKGAGPLSLDALIAARFRNGASS
jgi:putative oxidoreductase